jgi:hypothetical protein
MGILIKNTDFVGKFAIAQNSFSNIDVFITQYETNYLYDLLGKTLADLFIASVVNYVPVGAAYLAIYNTIELQYNCYTYRNEGMKNMLLGFLYYEYMRKNPIKSTISGQVINANENSTFYYDNWGMTNRYNESAESYQIIQQYISDNSTDYPDYLGQQKQYALPF